jgi:hypothetical protein
VIIQIFGDLHADVSAPPPIEIVDGVGAVVVAGDSCPSAQNALATLRRIVPKAILVAIVKDTAFDPALLMEIPV